MKKAIFALMTGTFTNQPAKFCRHVFAHLFLVRLQVLILG
jgi:hypothetical protein